MEIIPHSGYSLISIFRGLSGVFVLIFIAYIVSSDKKNIPWKTVGIALLTQLMIGIGILKIPIVKLFFEKIGKIFISIIESSVDGTYFLFGSLVNKNNEYIFALNVLQRSI